MTLTTLSLPALLLGSLLVVAALGYLFRMWERIVALVGAFVAGMWALVLWQIDLSTGAQQLPFWDASVDLTLPLSQGGLTLRLEPQAVPILATSMLLVAAAFLISASVSQGHSFVPFTLVLLAGYSAVALLTSGPLAPPLIVPLFLVGLNALGVFVLQAGRMESPSGPLRSLLPSVLAFPLFLIAAWYAQDIPLNPQDTTAMRITSQYLAVGLLILLAPFPLHGAQPAVAESSPPVVSALLLLLYQLAILHLLFQTITTFPFVPEQAPLGTWLSWAGLVTAVWGGVAAAGASDPGRLWGYTALHDWGLIILILAVPGSGSWPLVLFLFGLRVVSMLTAAAGLSVLQQHTGSIRSENLQGVGTRLPWNSAAFLLGGLGLAGFPLSAGFTGHWAALQVVAQTDWRPAAAVLLASGGAIFGFIRLARILFGPLANRYLMRERPLSIALAVAVLLISVSLAIAPQLMNEPIGRALLAFSR